MEGKELRDKITEGIDKLNQNENVKTAKEGLKKGSETLMNFITGITSTDTPAETKEAVEAEVVELPEENTPVEEAPASAVSFLKDGASKAGKVVTSGLGKAWSAVDGTLVKRKLLKEVTSYSLEELGSALKAASDVNDKELILNMIMRKKQLLALQSLGHDETLLAAAYDSIRAERDDQVAKLFE